MKLLITALVSLCFALGTQYLPVPFTKTSSGGTWSLHQFKNFDSNGLGTGGSSCASGGTGCTVTTIAPTAGDLVLIVGGIGASASAQTLSSVSMSGQTFTHCPHTGGSTTVGWLDCWYTLSAAASGTAATCTASGASTTYLICEALDYHWSGSSITLDNGPAVATDTSCTTCAAVALTAAGTDVVIQISIPVNSFTAISDATYNNPANFTDGFGTAGKLNASGTLTTPNWTQNTAGATAKLGLTFQGH